jgi:hypothetical protein
MGNMGRLMIQCNSCGGIYPDTTLPGTTRYFHVCPDRIVDQPEEVSDKNEVIKPATFKPTPNPRNENLKPDPEKKGEFVMVSEGSGVTKVE